MSTIKPTVSILDPSFRYVPAAQTDITKTFERARMEMRISSFNTRPIPVMYSSVPDVPGEELAQCAELLRQDYEEYGDPWYPRQKGGI